MQRLWMNRSIAYRFCGSFCLLGVLLGAILSAVSPYHTQATTGAAKTLHLPNSKVGDYLSPDKHYLARITIGEAEVKHLTLFKRSVDQKGKVRLECILPDITDVVNWMFIPKSDHRLVIAISGIYGDQGMLAIWTGGKSLTPLVKSKPSTKGYMEHYEIKGYDLKSRRLYYGRAILRAGSSDLNKQLAKTWSVKVP